MSGLLGHVDATIVLGLLLVISEYLGTNTKLRSNSILQVFILALRHLKGSIR